MNTERTPINRTLLQTFEWHTPSDQYIRLNRLLPALANLGITSLWLPPGCKGNNPKGNGYDIYDLWDLGEFDQKGARSTKWGSKEELAELIESARGLHLDVIWDAVLNHKAGADATEEVWAVEVDPEDRRYETCSPKKIQAWLRFEFPARHDRQGEMRYSEFKWHAPHFNGTDWDHETKKNAIHKLIDDPSTSPLYKQPKRPNTKILLPKSRPSLLRSRLSSFSRKGSTSLQRPPPPEKRPGKGWADDVDDRSGNNDFLMFSNIDYKHPAVQEDVMQWGEWMVAGAGIDGFRLDSAQHFSSTFTREWIQRVNDACAKQRQGGEIFIVGEVWSGEIKRILRWLDAVRAPISGGRPQVYAYDAPLLYNFSHISESVAKRTRQADLRSLLQNSLVERRPEAAVTLVTNHDTQPGQTLYTPMLSQLKALWYAFILLREDGYPCVFWGDLFGTKGPLAEEPACLVANASGQKRSVLPDLILCRRLFAYGSQTDYVASKHCIGWTRTGTGARPGCAVVINIEREDARKFTPLKMAIGKPGEVWTDALGQVPEDVTINGEGYGSFSCKGVSVFVRKDARGVDRFPVDFELDIYASS